jgi:hypothetical protein
MIALVSSTEIIVPGNILAHHTEAAMTAHMCSPGSSLPELPSWRALILVRSFTMIHAPHLNCMTPFGQFIFVPHVAHLPVVVSPSSVLLLVVPLLLGDIVSPGNTSGAGNCGLARASCAAELLLPPLKTGNVWLVERICWIDLGGLEEEVVIASYADIAGAGGVL